MKNKIIALCLCLITTGLCQAQYFGSSEWASDIRDYTNMSMFIQTNTINMQQMQKAYSETDTKSQKKQTDLANVKPVLFQPTGKRLFIEMVKAKAGTSEEQKKGLQVYSQLLEVGLTQYEKIAREKKQNPANLGLAVAFFMETTYALSSGKHLEDQQILDMAAVINQSLAKNAQFQKTSNQQRQLIYEAFVGPQLVNYMLYEQAKQDKDAKTQEQMKRQGLAFYKSLMGTEFSIPQ
ncbi:DUF6683 family protein [Xanthocytophaga agilis]|uniref:DUF4919 domain-containing protein n=1 Tax=Xanthocytophaga agilis TaxID=3048010 RepID=A0AAE3RAR9_9BACT|nr:DUF6683 family protein [Xanthocytophaga agilis]MDJ1506375.1 hypothetical protein [Xanthocytophaga agilis]